ncbi:UNVERIFIED_ORG: hypothetical protein J2W74_005202 [Methylorubrum zatmanii]
MSGRAPSLAVTGGDSSAWALTHLGQDGAGVDQQSIIPPQAAEPDAPASQDADAPASPDTEKAP